MRRAIALALLLPAAALLAQDVAPGAIQVRPDTVRWGPGNPSMPEGTRAAVLEGNPRAPGLFTMRMRVPAGGTLAPHWHPRDERVTVLEGKVAVGFGDAIDRAKVRRFGPGGFYVNPARSHHYVLFEADSVVQITGEGPWEMEFVRP